MRCTNLFIVLLLFGFISSQGQGAEIPSKPNILLLVADDQSPETINALGYPQLKTPNLDKLIKQGTCFSNAICSNPLCVPSRAEILTGRSSVGSIERAFNAKAIKLPSALKKAGYHTWYVGKWHNQGRPLDHGYDESKALFASGGGKWKKKDQKDGQGRPVTGYTGWIFQDDAGKKFPKKGVGLTPNISQHFADATIEFLNRKVQKPFFLHVNFTAPHDPLFMPPGYEKTYDAKKIQVPKNFQPEHPFDHGNLRGRDEKLLPWPRTKQLIQQDRRFYYSVISHLDAQVGRILQALEKSPYAKNTLVIYTSDHGLAMGSHGLRGKQNMYDHTIRVPLIFKGPGISAGQRIPAFCYLRDLFPTFCQAADVSIPKTVEGQSLWPLLLDNKKTLYPFAVGYFRDSQRMIRTQRFKLILYPQVRKTQLFDLQTDPHERSNLAADARYEEIKKELSDQLRNWQKKYNDPILKD